MDACFDGVFKMNIANFFFVLLLSFYRSQNKQETEPLFIENQDGKLAKREIA